MPTPAADTPAAALRGLKVVDLSRYVAGPHCTMILGDFGADVVKVERPGRGEDLRGTKPAVGGDSLLMSTLNRNKRSVAIDLYKDEGRALLKRLCEGADVLVENFRPGTLEEMGCGPEALRALNPRLIVVRISGFGQTGPLALYPAYDVIAQAMSGLMSATGSADSPPTMAGTIVIDYATALYAALGTMLALKSRAETGRGQVVDCTLLDCATSVLMGWIPEYLLLGRKPERIGSRDRYSAPSNTFGAADGRFVHIVASTDKQFAALARVMGRPELGQDPRFARIGERLGVVPELEAMVGAWMRSLDAADAVAAMQSAGVPCALVAEVSDLVENPQLAFRGSLVEVEHASGAKIPMQGPAIRLSDTPAVMARGVPSVGQHTAEVLAEWLGSGADETEGLVARGVVA